MILKIDGLTSAQFASLSNFLASEKNIIGEDNHSTMFATLITSKVARSGGQNVVLELVESFISQESEESFAERRKSGNYNPLGLDAEVRPVPHHYLLGLVQAAGRFL